MRLIVNITGWEAAGPKDADDLRTRIAHKIGQTIQNMEGRELTVTVERPILVVEYKGSEKP